MKIRLTLITLITIFSFTKQASAVDLNINNIQLGASLEQAVEEVENFKAKFDKETYEFNDRKGKDDNDNLVYYSSTIKPKTNNETYKSYENYLGIYVSNGKIWSVSRSERFKSGPLKQIFIDSLKEKYGEPTHSNGVSNDIKYAQLIWLYDDKDNRVEGSHNYDGFSLKNDVCDFRTSVQNKQITRFTDNPMCGKFIFIQISSSNSDPELVGSYEIISADYHNEYKNIIDNQNKKKAEAEKQKEDQRKEAENFKPDF